MGLNNEDASGFNEIRKNLKEDFELLFGECEDSEGVLRAVAEHIGVNDAEAIIEAAIEAIPNGEDYPYPAVHFNITLAKEVEPENFGIVASAINDINVILSTGEFPSFGNFCLYKPLRQIFYGYRKPINIGAAEYERENIRFFLATVLDQLDVFIDLILYVAGGNQITTLDSYLNYLRDISELGELEEKIKQLDQFFGKE